MCAHVVDGGEEEAQTSYDVIWKFGHSRYTLRVRDLCIHPPLQPLVVETVEERDMVRL